MPAGKKKGQKHHFLLMKLQDGYKTVEVGDVLYVRDPECAWRKKYVTVTKVGYKVLETDHGNLSFATDGGVRNSVHNYEIWSSKSALMVHDLYNNLDEKTKNKWDYLKDFFNLEGDLDYTSQGTRPLPKEETIDKLFEVLNGTS